MLFILWVHVMALSFSFSSAWRAGLNALCPYIRVKSAVQIPEMVYVACIIAPYAMPNFSFRFFLFKGLYLWVFIKEPDIFYHSCAVLIIQQRELHANPSLSSTPTMSHAPSSVRKINQVLFPKPQYSFSSAAFPL